MAIKKVEMFTVVCDNCKLDIGTDAEYSATAFIQTGFEYAFILFAATTVADASLAQRNE